MMVEKVLKFDDNSKTKKITILNFLDFQELKRRLTPYDPFEEFVECVILIGQQQHLRIFKRIQ